MDDQLEEVRVFRHPEHGIGQVSVAKTVTHETLLEDWWKLLHTKETMKKKHSKIYLSDDSMVSSLAESVSRYIPPNW